MGIQKPDLSSFQTPFEIWIIRQPDTCPRYKIWIILVFDPHCNNFRSTSMEESPLFTRAEIKTTKYQDDELGRNKKWPWIKSYNLNQNLKCSNSHARSSSNQKNTKSLAETISTNWLLSDDFVLPLLKWPSFLIDSLI